MYSGFEGVNEKIKSRCLRVLVPVSFLHPSASEGVSEEADGCLKTRSLAVATEALSSVSASSLQLLLESRCSLQLPASRAVVMSASDLL